MTESGRATVVVTGASTGIGRACAVHLATRGFEVLAGVRRDEDGERLLEAAGANVRLVALRLDVTDLASLREAGTVVTERTGERGLAGLVTTRHRPRRPPRVSAPGRRARADRGQLHRPGRGHAGDAEPAAPGAGTDREHGLDRRFMGIQGIAERLGSRTLAAPRTIEPCR